MAGIILCAGRGSRMGSTTKHKVCLPVAGRAAVVRLIDTLRADGVDPLIVVVGHRAGDVVETIGAAHPRVTFVYQRDRLGTGHGARIGMEALCRSGYDGPVLITMGDKWFEPGVIRNARRRFAESGADLLVVSTPKGPDSSAGRFVCLPGRGIVAVVERRDIERDRVLRDWLAMSKKSGTLSRAALRRAGLQRIRPTAKLWRALGTLARFAHGSGSVRAFELAQAVRETGIGIRVGDKRLGPDQVERHSPTINQSVYIGKTTVLQAALRRIGRANAQDEYYITDIVEIIAGAAGGQASSALVGGRDARPAASPSGTVPKVVEYRLRHRDEAMAYNTRAELRRIEERVLRDEQAGTARSLMDPTTARAMRTPDEWLNILRPTSSPVARLVTRTYGVGGPLIPERLRALRKVVRLFARAYGRDRRCFLVRAPGRVNLMGRHIDHQGGFVHAMALDREIIMAVAPRDDDVLRLVNTDSVAFPRRELMIGDWVEALATGDWLSFVDGEAVRAHLSSTVGDWSNYILAAALYQQHRHPHRRIHGMDAAVNGNVPMAAGLSSSSALVVASMEAITAVNGIRADPADIVTWCGQAEWFVGSRGGSADHAAIRLGRAGYAARIEFHPFRVSRYVPIPPDAAILIAYSGQHAVKSAGARDRFNERVACYRLGVLLLQRQYPRLASTLQYVRDLAPHRLGVEAPEAWKILASLPERITRREIVRRLGPSYTEQVQRIFASHADPGEYTVRDVVAFGVGECERARIAADYLQEGDLGTFGELMLISHDGDRVTHLLACPKVGDNGRATEGVETPLYRLAGAYACSTEKIDQIVDIVRVLPGVYGAQLAGAGLGGCVMILTKRSMANRVKAILAAEYYRPNGMVPAVWEVRSVSGGGVIRPA
jgi:N-acetylgalactosamine kinase